mmetsp:Transcript_26577/g.92378  ORF Transcript_26577/g.92378 Transcript_26577/m.92378 type:complete len:470 (+) Transcript_26577:2163-3572(+)
MVGRHDLRNVGIQHGRVRVRHDLIDRALVLCDAEAQEALLNNALAARIEPHVVAIGGWHADGEQRGAISLVHSVRHNREGRPCKGRRQLELVDLLHQAVHVLTLPRLCDVASRVRDGRDEVGDKSREPGERTRLPEQPKLGCVNANDVLLAHAGRHDVAHVLRLDHLHKCVEVGVEAFDVEAAQDGDAVLLVRVRAKAVREDEAAHRDVGASAREVLRSHRVALEVAEALVPQQQLLALHGGLARHQQAHARVLGAMILVEELLQEVVHAEAFEVAAHDDVRVPVAHRQHPCVSRSEARESHQLGRFEGHEHEGDRDQRGDHEAPDHAGRRHVAVPHSGERHHREVERVVELDRALVRPPLIRLHLVANELHEACRHHEDGNHRRHQQYDLVPDRVVGRRGDDVDGPEQPQQPQHASEFHHPREAQEADSGAERVARRCERDVHRDDSHDVDHCLQRDEVLDHVVRRVQ